jgi:diguanylate cyclase (GGDEF)-like protein
VSAVQGGGTPIYARVNSASVRAAGAPVAVAALMIGISAGVACWAAEAGILSHSRSSRLADVRTALRDARVLLGSREQSAARQAARLAGRADVQAAFVQHDASSLAAISSAHPDVGFTLWDGRGVGLAASGLPGAAITVYSHGIVAGRVVVAVQPDRDLLAAARSDRPHVHLLYTVGGRVAAASPPVGNSSVAELLRATVNDTLTLSSGVRMPASLYGATAAPKIPLRRTWAVVVALFAMAVAFRLLGSREATRRAEPPPNTVREAVALVGETLAATHNPDALLPVILQAAVEATEAAGGTIRAADVTLASRGARPSESVETIEVPLEVSEGRSAVMTLYPPRSGFGAEARDAAEWIAAQALIALENARLHGQVQRQAVTDELTGLANRRQFLQQLETEVTRSRRSGSSLGIVLADLDDFKRVNDTYGHEAGDEALWRFAEILRASVRDIDLPVRLGGEEFAVLLPDTDVHGAVQLAERIRQRLEASELLYGRDRIKLTASFGVSCFPGAAGSDDLLTDADRRLYDAKRRGKNTVVASEPQGTLPAS